MIWYVTIRLLPGGPGEDRLRELYSVVAGDVTFFDARREGAGGAPLLMDDPVGYLADKHLRAYNQGTFASIDLFGPGPLRHEHTYMNVWFGLVPGATGHIRGRTSAEDPQPLVDAVVRLSVLLEAPIATVTHVAASTRSQRHLEAAREQYGRDAFPFWERMGLSAITYRTVIGQPFIDLFGPSKLAALTDDLGWERDGLWVLAGAAEPEAWSDTAYNTQERALIDQLGWEHFFDIETGALPTSMPDMPEHPSYPVYVKTARNAAVEVLPGGALPPVPSPIPARKGPGVLEGQWVALGRELDLVDLVRMFNTMTEHVGSMVASFWEDDPVYWVEEFLRGRHAEGELEKYAANAAAWVGGFLRDYSGCEWVKAPEPLDSLGWMIEAPDGSLHDPLAAIRSIRHDRQDPVLKPMFAEIDPTVNLVRPDG